MLDTVQPVLEAVEKGDLRRARQLLRPLLENPTADVWYAASFVYEQPDHQIGCLRRSLKIDPMHGDARRRLKLLRDGKPLPERDLLPSLDALVATVKAPEPPPPAPRSIWNLRRRRRSRRWALVGIAGSALLSLSAAYFVLTVLGSPIAAQVRGFFTGSQPVNEAEGTPVFGQPSSATFPTPVRGAPAASASPVAMSSDNQVRVRTTQSKPLDWESPLSDVLDSGYAHEYTFTPRVGDEVAIGIQFFSPTAQNVGPNVAVLNPSDHDAEGVCQRDSIMQDGSGTAFICQIDEPGTWKVQLLGRLGESTGVYIITIDRF
jgi:hypothetical protein